ncbi:MAG: VWA domain-containing protein [Spirochaetes bacterium]|nr:VWA domain-containing protein [Spirochaetota bacterium]
MKRSLLIILSLVLLAVFSFSPTASAKEKPHIQVAVLLDTSNSMDGLIDQAKSHLWKIVNELASAKKDGQVPKLEVSLYEYGKDSIAANEGYLRMVLSLSTDLDKVSEELFALKTYGGQEYCGKVIESATTGLTWSKNKDDLKMIFIAGNEPFTQGDVDYKNACKNAIKNSIIVNTIFCGSYQDGIDTQWKDGADLADGQYANIDQNQELTFIQAPQDDEIAKLGKQLNKTYIAYGSLGLKNKKRQEEQDSNAASVASEVMVQRSVAKSSAQYNNSGWDMVDAEKEGKLDLDKVKDDELPDEMKGMSKKEKKEYIEEQKKKRDSLQAKIKKLNEARNKYIAKERTKQAKDNTLDSAIIKAIRKQAKKRNFSIK